MREGVSEGVSEGGRKGEREGEGGGMGDDQPGVNTKIQATDLIIQVHKGAGPVFP